MAAEGDLRVLLVLDLALSFFFSVMVVTLLDFAGINEFSWPTVAVSTLFLAVVTYAVVLR
ncbi:hypothetical protein SAMN05216559_3985 [Halomicrobium zhouii]|uniref:DUF8107 domain-containing protein n=1 Tax=Halomicrobium zhouii TaxID=767519 RepID=A0A1I6M8V1_9EURY|nr:hypothetical protein [Halomicrobium zhouii]SFS11972.1 hypothetical protein SAMN05216559_3985 [Halomicrobium zhouii]